MLYKIIIFLLFSAVAFGQFTSDHTGDHIDSVITGIENLMSPTPSQGSVPLYDATNDFWVDVSKSAFRDTIGLVTVGIKEFGAKIDNSTDDITAINSAIASLTNGGRLVWNGGNGDTSLISGEIKGLPNIIYDFNGVVVKLMDDSDTTMMAFSDASNVVFMNGTLDGNMANQTALWTAGDATTAGYKRYGIDITGGDNVLFWNMEFNRVRYGGVIIDPAASVESDVLINYKFINCRFTNMGASAIRLANLENVLIDGCYFSDWGQYNNSKGLAEVWGFEHPMIQIDGGFSVDYFKYVNNAAYAVSDSGFSIESARVMIGAQIIGNQFFGDYTGVSGHWINSNFAHNIFDSSSVNSWRAGFEIPGYGNICVDNIINGGAINLGSTIGNLTHGDIDTVHGRQNTVSRNTIHIRGTSNHGISVGDAVEDDSLSIYNISDNIINVTGATNPVGIYLGRNSSALISEMDLDNNIIFRTDAADNGIGIRFLTLDGSNNIRIKGGKVFGLATGISFAAPDATLDRVYISGVDLRNVTTPILGSLSPGTLYVKDNLGYLTANSGTATVLNGNTTIVVTHGLDITPLIKNISVTPIETLASASFWWVDTITSTQFTINVNADPTQDVDFVWQINEEVFQ